MEFKFNIKNFEGPLDLLVSLIKDKKQDILEINLLELAERYLEIIENLESTNIDLASEYLVMAATLIQIKARRLLNNENNVDESDEDEQRLMHEIYEHIQFKKIATQLRKKEAERKDIFIKLQSNYEPYYLKKNPTALDGKSRSTKLMNVLRKMLERTYAEKLKKTKLKNVHISAFEMRNNILDAFKNNEIVTFKMIFSKPTLEHLVITFLALLDLVRQQVIVLSQNNQFGEIIFKKGEEYVSN